MGNVTEDVMKKEEKVTRQVTKKKYTPPALKVYGKLSELTAGGTKGNTEGGSGRMDKKK